MTATTATILGELGPRTRASRLLMRAAVVWLASSVVHTGVYAVDGGAWSGPLSWRKPIVFSLSFALTLWAVGWALDRLPTERPRLAGVLAWTFVLSSSLEVSLIAMQTWRGRASHFNVFEARDALVFEMMGISVGFVAVVLVAVLVWAIWERPTDPATRWAVIGGLATIAAGLGVGQWIINLGTAWLEANGAVPATVMNGEAVAKFPHAVAFHGIQVFAVILAMAKARGLATDRALSILRAAVGGYVGLLTWATAGALLGRTPLAAGGVLVAVAVASMAALGWSMLAVLAAPGASLPEPT